MKHRRRLHQEVKWGESQFSLWPTGGRTTVQRKEEWQDGFVRKEKARFEKFGLHHIVLYPWIKGQRQRVYRKKET
eukprot:scaffold1221_cov207-Amphora_coffeaeformis.AAC.18